MSLNSCREEEHAPLHVHRTALPFYMMSLGRWKSTKRSDQELQCPLFSIIAMNDIHPKERIVQLHTLTSIISVFLTSLNINVWRACVLSDTFRDKKKPWRWAHTHTSNVAICGGIFPKEEGRACPGLERRIIPFVPTLTSTQMFKVMQQRLESFCLFRFT